MAKTRKPKNPTIQQYNKVRAALRRQVRSMEKRGYFWREQIIPEKPKKITAASVRRLQKVKEKLYETARFRLPSGEETGGRYARDWERRQAAKKAAQSRKRKWESAPPPPPPPHQEDIYLQRIMRMVNDIATRHPAAATLLLDEIENEIDGANEEEKKANRVRVAKQLDEAGTHKIEMLSVEAWYHRMEASGMRALTELRMILSGGVIPTAEELKEMNAAYQQDEAWEEGFEQIAMDPDEFFETYGFI